MRKIKFLLFAFLFLLVAGSSVFAQQPPSGLFMGKVSDDQGNPLPGVTVEATAPTLIGRVTAVTDATGTYRLFGIPSGSYEITFTLQGFKKLIRKEVLMGLHQTITLNATLETAAIEESVTVVGMTPLIDVKTTTKGMTLTKEMFASLPKGRNFDQLVAVIPGVVQEDYLLGGTSVDGASGDENMYYIDGTYTNNIVNGTPGQGVNFDFVDEVQFNASGYNAEFGGSMGGVINVVSRRGGNSFHGEVLGYWNSTSIQTKYRDQLDQDYITEGPNRIFFYPYDVWVGVDDMNRFEYGINLSGYIIRDRLWFFGSYMPVKQTRDRTLDYSIQGRDLVRDFTRDDWNWNAMAKLTAQIRSNLRLSAGWIDNQSKYLGDNPEAHNASATGKFNSGWSYPNMSVNGTLDWSVGNNFMVSARGGYFYTDQKNSALPPGTDTPRYRFVVDQPYNYIASNNRMFPEIPAALQHGGGWQNKTGAENQAIEAMWRSRYNANLDGTYFLNWQGEHSIKAGFQFIRQGENVAQNSATGPYVMFGWDMDLVLGGVEYGRGTYGWYSVRGNDKTGPYGNLYNVYANNYALYLQDSWTIKNKLTLNFGLRAEHEYLPNYTAGPVQAIDFPWGKKLSPRFGLIYDVFGDSSLKIFASYGIYRDMMKTDLAVNAYGGLKWKSAYYLMDDWDYTKIGVGGNYPGTYLTTYDYRPFDLDLTDPDIKPFTQREVSLGVEKKLRDDLSVSVRGVWKTVLTAIEDSAIYALNQEGNWEEKYFISNPGSDFLKKKYDEAIAGGQLNPGTPYIPKATRDYIGLNISLDKRFAKNWLAGFNFTLSRLSGNYSGLFSSDEIRNSPNGERAFDLWYLCYDKQLHVLDGPLPTDRPLVFKLYGSYAFPFGLTVGALFNAMSGTPLTEEWQLDSAGYYPNNRANLGRTPFMFLGNLYASYDIKIGRTTLQFNANIDNVFDVKTSRRTYVYRYWTNVGPIAPEGGDPLYMQRVMINDPNWVPNVTPDAMDPNFGQKYQFYPPLVVRLGIMFRF